MKYLKLVEKFIKENCESREWPHFIRTKYWTKRLKPQASEALLIAAVAHDIERVFRLKNKSANTGGKGFLDTREMKRHSKEGAELIAKFLNQQKVPKLLIKKIKHLIIGHELGGDRTQNILRDADSISFFENQVVLILKRHQDQGLKEFKKKFDWMFKRIGSQKAKAIARPMYEQALSKLNKI